MFNLHTRFLTLDDIPALLELEHSKWEEHQAASGDALRRRIVAHPLLSIGAFCPHTGKALASLFMCPVDPAMFTAPTTWNKAAESYMSWREGMASRRSLFGISLSSNSARAVKEIFAFFYPRALADGWTAVYLGSPIPGFKAQRLKNPDLTVWQYVHARRNRRSDEPLDPQLRYYYRRGFRQIVSVQRDYFPHEESLDYGVILRGAIPFARSRPLWKIVPFFVLEYAAALLFRLER